MILSVPKFKKFYKIGGCVLLPIFFFSINYSVFASNNLEDSLLGRILLQTEENGEAWYVNPEDRTRYYLGRPADAFDIMRSFGVGISNKDLIKIEKYEDPNITQFDLLDTDNDGFSDNNELLNGFNPYGIGKLEIDPYFSAINAGKIFLQVEQNGEAWYVNPINLKRYYLGRPMDAFNIMRSLGLGVSNSDLSTIRTKGQVEIKEIKTEDVLHNVPFTPQAPFGNWSDARQEDGCEESSVLMAMRWVGGESLSRDEALEEILAISDFELEKYGEFHDSSAEDTMDRIFKDYFNYHKVLLVRDFLAEDIIKELGAGHLVIVPVNGQKLGNPYFTQPGPERHMLLIKGWDSASNEFITNEPGTKRGESYRYDKDILYEAIRDYVSGFHLPITTDEKAAIVVEK